MSRKKFPKPVGVIEPKDLGPCKVHPWVIPHIDYEEYAPKFKEFFHLDRTENGVLTAKWHTEDEPLLWSIPIHRAIWQLFMYVGQDPLTEVFILGGVGDEWVGRLDDRKLDEVEHEDWLSYEHMYQDGCNICEYLINVVQVPTIGVINGPGYHAEMALFCDVTLMSDDAFISDIHFTPAANMVPGDGIQIALQECMGTKRANYMMLTGQAVDAKTALDYGLVNEVLPREKLYERAQELAQYFMKMTRKNRRVTVQVLRRPWKNRLANELRDAFGAEMWCTISEHCEHQSSDYDELQAMAKKQFEGKDVKVADISGGSEED
jgi:enoyl-CoA hydratase/carnithine racemase